MSCVDSVEESQCAGADSVGGWVRAGDGGCSSAAPASYSELTVVSTASTPGGRGSVCGDVGAPRPASVVGASATEPAAVDSSTSLATLADLVCEFRAAGSTAESEPGGSNDSSSEFAEESPTRRSRIPPGRYWSVSKAPELASSAAFSAPRPRSFSDRSRHRVPVRARRGQSRLTRVNGN